MDGWDSGLKPSQWWEGTLRVHLALHFWGSFLRGQGFTSMAWGFVYKHFVTTGWGLGTGSSLKWHWGFRLGWRCGFSEAVKFSTPGLSVSCPLLDVWLWATTCPALGLSFLIWSHRGDWVGDPWLFPPRSGSRTSMMGSLLRLLFLTCQCPYP